MMLPAFVSPFPQRPPDGFGVRSAPRSTSKEINLWARLPQAANPLAWGLVEIHHCRFCGEAVEACRLK